MSGNTFTHDKRRRRTEQQYLRIFEAAGGKCYICGTKFFPGDDFDFDHVIALENGGTDDDDNLAPICPGCHTKKTGGDHGQASRGRKAAARYWLPSKFHGSKSWGRR